MGRCHTQAMGIQRELTGKQAVQVADVAEAEGAEA